MPDNTGVSIPVSQRRGGVADDETRALVEALRKLLAEEGGQGLDLGRSTRDTNVDALQGGLDLQQMAGRREFAPFASGIRALFLGGNPFPEPPDLIQAREDLGRRAEIANALDAFTNTPQGKRLRENPIDLGALLGSGAQLGRAGVSGLANAVQGLRRG